MKTFSLTALLIVRNESRTIKRCLDNIIGKFDTVVIIDTGSTDDTLHIINKFTGERLSVFYYKWNDSFADARNYALTLTRNRYIFLLMLMKPLFQQIQIYLKN